MRLAVNDGQYLLFETRFREATISLGKDRLRQQKVKILLLTIKYPQNMQFVINMVELWCNCTSKSQFSICRELYSCLEN